MPNNQEQLATVLVVDDSPENIAVLQETLSPAYKVKAALSGERALKIAQGDNPPDIILLDILMPEMDGYEVCRRLKGTPQTAEIPVIFVTVKSEVEDETAGFGLGAVDYITKPIRPPVVLARVAAHLTLHWQRRQLQRQNQLLKDYARMRDQVERMTCHDLKSPLTSVLTVPEMLMAEPGLAPKKKMLLQMIQQSGYRMLHIINSSLDLYKMETGRYQLNPEPVNVVRVLDQIGGEVRQMMRQKDLTVSATLNGRPAAAGDALWVSGEEMLLYSMLSNLVKNAVEASPKGEVLTVSLEQGDQAVVNIHNQGAVPEEIRDRFFDKFVTAGKEGGTGLGAYTAKLIAATLGGEIAMHTSEAEGTSITLRLPLWRQGLGDREGQAALDTACGPEPWPCPDPIMVVDDYPDMRRITQSTLRRMGHTNILEAPDGEAAWRMLADQNVGLIISGLNLPKLGGLDLLERVRAKPESAATPFILVASEADYDTARAAAEDKRAELIMAPYSPDTLKAKVDQALGAAPPAQ